MSGLFQGLEIGKRALLTQQLNLQTIGHNIANVDTPGYSRQRVSVTTTSPEYNAFGSVGTGVKASDIRHIKDIFLNEQYRQSSKELGEWSYKEKIYTQIETIFNEPNDNTLGDLITNFWNAWYDFANNPESSTRQQIVSQTNLLNQGFRDMAIQLDTIRDSVDLEISAYSSDINQLTSEIATINHQIGKLELGGTMANDLRDQRDLLVDQLAQIIDVNTIEQPNGQITVYVGAMSIVNGNEALPIEVKVENEDGKLTHNLYWGGTDVLLSNQRGELAALIESRDKIIPKYTEELDKVAQSIISQVNAIHENGMTADGATGIEFFDSSKRTAYTISLSEDIINDYNNIVSSASGLESDNRLAIEIAALNTKGVLNNGTASIKDYYNELVGNIGIETREATSYAENYSLILEQVEFSKESVQGVSIDEEMTNMVKAQHSYDAAARIITTMDQALDTVINNMGLVGR